MTRTCGFVPGLAAAMAVAACLPAQSFGVACGGQGGVPAIDVQPAMRPGSSSTVTIANLPQNRPALLWLGSSNATWGGVPLPLPLAPLGMTGCELAIRPEVGLLFHSGTGTASSAFYVPLDPTLAAQRLYWQVMFAQPGLNPSGTGWSRALESRIAPLPTPTTMVSSITQYGITFQFAAPVPAGQFWNGDWFVVGPVTLTGMTPPCVTVNGRVMHGAMVNPDASTRAHGYDKALYGPGNEALYFDTLNVALNLSSAQPRVLQPNQSSARTARRSTCSRRRPRR
jgi:hypothetical protein